MRTLEGRAVMKSIIYLTLIGLLAASGHIQAQETNIAPAAPGSTVLVSNLQAEMTEAVVRKVDVAGGKITLKHGEIKNLEMPPMTMVFQVKDRAFLTRFKAGDPVRFTAEKIKGAYTVTSIELIQ